MVIPPEPTAVTASTPTLTSVDPTERLGEVLCEALVAAMSPIAEGIRNTLAALSPTTEKLQGSVELWKPYVPVKSDSVGRSSRRKSREGGDPDDSPGSSDSDDQGFKGKRDKDKDGKSSDEEDIFKSMPFRRNSEKKKRKSLGERRRQTLLTPTTSQPRDRGRGAESDSGSRSSVNIMKPAVPRDAIRLTRLTIESVTWFTEKFNLLDGGTEEKLKMGHFIQEDTLEMMVTIADRENLPGGDGIINKGRQVIENEDVFHLLAHIVTPIDKQGMMDALRVSVYSATDLDRFEAKYGTEIKPEKYDDFYNIMCTY